MHCDLELWPFVLKIYRAHPWLMWSLHVKFHDNRCKGKAVMHQKPFSVIYALWPWPFDLKIYRAHPCLMGSLHVKFHDDRCKGKAVMRWKPFSVIYALWPWPFDLKIYRTHPWLMGSLHVKFHDDKCKGKAVTVNPLWLAKSRNSAGVNFCTRCLQTTTITWHLHAPVRCYGQTGKVPLYKVKCRVLTEQQKK